MQVLSALPRAIITYTVHGVCWLAACLLVAKHMSSQIPVRLMHVGMHGPVFVENDADISAYVHITNGALQR